MKAGNFLFLFFALMQSATLVLAQDGQSRVVYSELKPLIYWDTAYSDKKADAEKLFQKKMPKKMFYGKKTKKAYTKKYQRGKPALELFFVLKKWEDPNPFVQEIYWYDKKRKEIRTGPIPEKDKPFAKICHGPYQKLWKGVVVEEGQFYIGTKHGRWMQYDGSEQMQIVDKSRYYKGFYRESLISFLDPERKKVKEAIQIKDGLKHGEYLRYYDTGELEIKGEYDFGVRVGVWYEYHRGDGKRLKRKRMIRYPPSYHKRKEFAPYVVLEYDEDGKLTYDHKKEERQKDFKPKRPDDYDPKIYGESQDAN